MVSKCHPSGTVLKDLRSSSGDLHEETLVLRTELDLTQKRDAIDDSSSGAGMSVAVRLSVLSSLSPSLHPILDFKSEVSASLICKQWRPKTHTCLPSVARKSKWVVKSGWWDSFMDKRQEDTEWVLFRDGKLVPLSKSAKNTVKRRKELDVAELISLIESDASSHKDHCNEPSSLRREDSYTDACEKLEEQLSVANETASAQESINASADESTATELPIPQGGDEGVDHPAQVLDGVREDISAAAEDEVSEENGGLSHDAILPPKDPPSSSGMEPEIAPTIELHYDTGWENVYLHFCVDNTRWTDPPGHLMFTASCEEEELPALKMIVVEGQSMEFLLNNGHGDWDRSPDGGNYCIGTPGVYVLSFGELKELPVLQPIELT